jgi:hypothetical protein
MHLANMMTSVQTPVPQTKQNQKGWNGIVVKAVECLPSKHKALSSKPSTANKITARHLLLSTNACH